MNIRHRCLRLLVLPLAISLSFAQTARAEGWCEMQPGWEVQTHGSMGNTVWIVGAFAGTTTWRWIALNNPSTGVGQASVAVAIAAQMAGRGIHVYLDGPTDTCSNFANWSGVVRHVRPTPQ
jgi:hypothetical protein